MHKLSVEVSSLFPIDLTSCIFFQYLYGPTPVRILLNTELATNSSAQHATGVSRGSFPLYQLDYKGNFDWQTAHTTGDQGSTHIDQFNESLTVLKEMTAECEATVHARIGKLSEIASRINTQNQEGVIGWQETAQPLISHIYNEFGVPRTQFLDISGARREGALNPAQKAALRSLLANAPQKVTKLTDGGLIEIFEPISGQWKRATEIVRKGDEITLLNSRNQENVGCISLENIQDHRIRLKGSLELVIVAEEEYLIPDFPWYMTNYHQASEFIGGCLEVISPISVKARERIQQRLNPSGYLLPDYAHENIVAFSSAIMGGSIASNYFQSDFQRLSQQPPRTDTRLSKNQAAIRQFVANLISETRKSVALNNYIVPDIFANHLDSNDCFSLGKKLVSFAVALELSKPSKWKDANISDSSAKFLASLFCKDYVTNQDLIDWSLKVTECHFGIMKSRGEMPVRDQSAKELQKVKAQLNSNDGHAPASSELLTALVQWSTDAANAYYAWFAAQTTGNLKAHLVAIYALLDKEQLRSSIQEILQTREKVGNQVLYYKPQFWEE